MIVARAGRQRTGGGRFRTAALAAALLASLAAAGPVAAGSFQVNPVNVEIPQSRRAAAVTVSNRGTAPVSVRVRLLRWTQADGEDVYLETDDLVASPAMFTMAPDRTQLVRVGPRGAAASGAYRIILEEIPGPAAEGSAIRVALRLNLPLYVVPDNGGRAELSWSAWQDSSGETIVEARNAGTRHSQILALGAIDAAGRETSLSTRMGVVLPGGGKSWRLGRRPDLNVGAQLILNVRDGNGATAQNRIPIARR
jgi:fimbrial chaperone protein